MNDMWDYEYDYKVPKREVPRFVPPIEIEFVESEKLDLDLAQPEARMEGYTWVMGNCEDMRMPEVEGLEDVKVCA
ncbi:hypothetical protein NHQ30_004057 [Ciborinia camelliae]|nr:hypothetical protein NHQ30_004057 [Ciborinia camelliae]